MPLKIANKYSIPLFLGLIAAGLAGNYFKFPIFLNIDFLFGSIFAMLALQFFGLGRGILAAAIIASYTYILWNHPYAIITMTAEVAVVGWLMTRRKMGLVLADTLYWLLIGMPLVYLFYHTVMHVSFSDTPIFMTKQAMNGIANTVIARLIFTGYALRSRSSATSYREIVYNLLTFFVLFPALIVLAIGSRTDFTETDHRIRTTLIQDSKHEALTLENWVANRKTAISNLAEMADSRPPQQMQIFLEQAKKSDVNFLRIGLLDRNAKTTAYFPSIDGLGQSNIGKSCADLPFIPTLKQTLKPMLSEVVMSKVGTPKPVVSVLAPVVMRGDFGGFVIGILSLQQMREHLDKSPNQNARFFTLLDKNGNVIMTNRLDQKVMSPFVRGKGTHIRLGEGINQWVPAVPSNTLFADRWKKSFYIVETAIGNLAEWKLILEQPVAPFQKMLYDSYTSKLTLLFLVLLGALLLAEFLSRNIVVTLEQLRALTTELPVRLATDSVEIAWPESGIDEAWHLINNFKEMTNSLSEHFIEIRQINESLEQRVEERTAKLQESEYLFRESQHAAAIGSFKADFVAGLWESSEVLDDIFGIYKNYNRSIHAWLQIVHPDDKDMMDKYLREVVVFNGNTFSKEFRILRNNDGESRWVYGLGKVTLGSAGKVISVIGTIQDITARKRGEEEHTKLERQMLNAQKLESLGVLAGGIAHDFNNILMTIIGNADLALARINKESPGVENLHKIEEAAFRAADLAKQMLAYSGKGKFVVEHINLNRLLEDMLHMLEVSISKKAVLRLNLIPNLPSVEADATQMRQIVMNLLINASEAIGDKSGVIAITTGCMDCDKNYLKDVRLDENIGEGLYVYLEIADTGCGMDKETMAKIFDPFFTTKFTGRGLGMAAVLGIVRGHKGAIKVYSELGKGTSFKVLLPASDKPANIFNHDSQVDDWKGSGTVLLVDDEETIRGIGREMLRELGFEVITAGDGREAVEFFKTTPNIVFVILDLTMPHVDGEQCFRELRQLNPDVKVIMSSGYNEQEVTQKFVGKGLAGFVQKPYKLSTLKDAIRNTDK